MNSAGFELISEGKYDAGLAMFKNAVEVSE
jgi:hypothetical protein